uniref:Uncharacterized protein n=1 Tax=Setaria digitata TaxID=48799 RepID=A0A915PUL8_9BILA
MAQSSSKFHAGENSQGHRLKELNSLTGQEAQNRFIVLQPTTTYRSFFLTPGTMPLLHHALLSLQHRINQPEPLLLRPSDTQTSYMTISDRLRPTLVASINGGSMMIINNNDDGDGKTQRADCTRVTLKALREKKAEAERRDAFGSSNEEERNQHIAVKH